MGDATRRLRLDRRTGLLVAIVLVVVAAVATAVVSVAFSTTPGAILERAWQEVTGRRAAIAGAAAVPLVALAAVLVGAAGRRSGQGRRGLAIGGSSALILGGAAVTHALVAAEPVLAASAAAAAATLLVLAAGPRRWMVVPGAGGPGAAVVALMGMQAGAALIGLGAVAVVRSDWLADVPGWPAWLATAVMSPWSGAWAIAVGLGLVLSAAAWWRRPDEGRATGGAWGLAIAWVPLVLLLGMATTLLSGAPDGAPMAHAMAAALPGLALAIGHLAAGPGGPAPMTVRVDPSAVASRRPATGERLGSLAAALVLVIAVLPGAGSAVLGPDWRGVLDRLAPLASRWDALVVADPGAATELGRQATAMGLLDGLPPRMPADDPALASDAGPYRVWLLGSPASVPAPAGYVERSTLDVRGLTIRLATRPQVAADVAVYGATPSGVMAAISARQAGADVVLMAADAHVGGMTTSGLGHTDIGDKTTVGGLALAFYTRIGAAYEMTRYGNFLAWDHEPSVAQAVIDTMLKDAGVRVLPGAALDRVRGVQSDGRRITSLTTTDGTRISAASFVDASYEGDLMAAAGVPWTIGREASATYGESLAGVRPVARPDYKQQVFGRSYRTGELLPGISEAPVAAPGSADERVQAYTFRLCVTDIPERAVPFPAPTGYDRGSFVLVERAIETWTRRAGEPPPLDAVLTITRLPNGTGDLNNARLFSTDVIGESTGWAEADDAERARIREVHLRWVAGLLHFLSTDEAVPTALRSAVAAWGLCRDEFAATDHFPPQLYVREARRLLGDVVLTQADVQSGAEQPDPVAIGSYRIDNHVVQRVVDEDGIVLGEGSLDADVRPYHIPMRALLPPRGSVENLVVGVTVSASHVAWSSLRMEPTFMMLGEAAGLIARETAATGVAVQDVPYATIATALRARDAVLDLADAR